MDRVAENFARVSVTGCYVNKARPQLGNGQLHQARFALDTFRRIPVLQPIRSHHCDGLAVGSDAVDGIVLAVAYTLTMFLASSVHAGESRLSGLTGTIWVTREMGNTVAKVESATGKVLAVIPVGKSPVDLVAPKETGRFTSRMIAIAFYRPRHFPFRHCPVQRLKEDRLRAQAVD